VTYSKQTTEPNRLPFIEAAYKHFLVEQGKLQNAQKRHAAHFSGAVLMNNGFLIKLE
jgi:hypothetical protein